MLSVKLNQSLAMANNAICNKDLKRAVTILVHVQKCFPEDPRIKTMMERIARSLIEDVEPFHEFGTDWTGQDLHNKTIEVFCDCTQIQFVSALMEVVGFASEFRCKVFLNNYRHHDYCKTFFEYFDFPDISVCREHVLCDYRTDISKLPKAECRSNLSVEPWLIKDGRVKIGLEWDDEPFYQLESTRYDLYQLSPCLERFNFVVQIASGDLLQNARLVQSMDAVVAEKNSESLVLAKLLGVPAFEVGDLKEAQTWIDEVVLKR